MFDWMLWLVLVLVCVPGVFIVAPGVLDRMVEAARKRLGTIPDMPPRPVVIALAVLQSLILIALAAAVGVWLAPKVGFSAPFFEVLVAGESLWPAIMPQLGPTLLVSILGSAAFLALYYLYFRPRLDPETLAVSEELRNGLGLAGRVLYGGIVEEVLTRWGLLTLLVWLGSLIVGQVTPALIWVAIVVAGVLFGLGHLPSYLGAGCRKTPIFVASSITLNLWASLIFGWLFWQYGLLAAMLAHALFHLIWYPFDLHYYEPEQTAEAI